MQVLTSNAGGPGEQVSLLTTQGEPFQVALAASSSFGGVPPPLSTAFYVDANNAGTNPPNGSQASPFRSIQSAIDAVTVANTVIYCAFVPGGNTENLTIPPGNPLTLIGINAPLQQDVVTLNGNITVHQLLTIQNFFVAGTINDPDQENDVILFDTGVSGLITCASLTANSSFPAQHALGGGANISGDGKFHNMNCQGNYTATGSLRWTADSDPASPDGCVAGSSGTQSATGNIYASGVAIATSMTSDSMKIANCSLGASLTLTCTSSLGGGAIVCDVSKTVKPTPTDVITFVASIEGNALQVDRFSNQWMDNSSFPTFGQLRVVGADPSCLQLDVNVPAVAAGDVAYLDISLAGTVLNGLTTSDVVVGNPQSDLVAAGAGGGYIGCRVSATNTLRLAFVGPLANTLHDFLFARLTRSPLP